MNRSSMNSMIPSSSSESDSANQIPSIGCSSALDKPRGGQPDEKALLLLGEVQAEPGIQLGLATRPIAQEMPNDDLGRRVSNFLNSRHFDSFRDLDIEVNNGAVIISGKLNNYHEKQVALSCCQRVAGVVTLVDRIKVAKKSR